MNAAMFPDLIVNGEHVPHTLVAAETQNQDAPKGKPGIAWRKAANAVAIRTLLLQEARSRGIAADPQEVGPGRFETDEEARIRGLLEEAIDVGAPDDAAIEAEWSKDPSRFRSPPLWEVSHILIACDPRDAEARDRALNRAKKLLDIASNDPKAFAALAARAGAPTSMYTGISTPGAVANAETRCPAARAFLFARMEALCAVKADLRLSKSSRRA